MIERVRGALGESKKFKTSLPPIETVVSHLHWAITGQVGALALYLSQEALKHGFACNPVGCIKVPAGSPLSRDVRAILFASAITAEGLAIRSIATLTWYFTGYTIGRIKSMKFRARKAPILPISPDKQEPKS